MKNPRNRTEQNRTEQTTTVKGREEKQKVIRKWGILGTLKSKLFPRETKRERERERSSKKNVDELFYFLFLYLCGVMYEAMEKERKQP